MDAAVEHLQQGFHGGQADAGEALGQGVGPQQHDGPGHVLLKGIAHAAGVGDDQVVLELVQLGLGDGHVDELAKAGVQAIDHLLLGDVLLHDVAGDLNGLFGLFSQGDLCAMAADSYHVFQGEAVTVQINCLFHVRSPPKFINFINVCEIKMCAGERLYTFYIACV